MKKVIAYRKQRYMVSSAEEAIAVIETFEQEAIGGHLIVHESCRKQIEKSFEQDEAITKLWPYNSGSRYVTLVRALADTLEEHQRIADSQREQNAFVQGLKTKTNRRELNFNLNERKDGVYHVTTVLIYETNGKTKRTTLDEEVKAFSCVNAYNKVTDIAVKYCDANGFRFVMLKELLSKYTEINWLHE